MKIEKIIILLALIFSTGLNSQSIEEEINKFAGKFSGECKTYKLDSNIEVVKSFSLKILYKQVNL